MNEVKFVNQFTNSLYLYFFYVDTKLEVFLNDPIC